MDLLFVALNAPENSNANAHWFSNNLSFWNLLYRSGIIMKPIKNKLKGDITVFGDNSINYKNWNIGVTDLNRKDVETNSSNVKVTASDVERILSILDNNKVSRVCLMHKKVGEAFRTYSPNFISSQNKYGEIGEYKNTSIFEVPFHSGNSIPNKEKYYSLLIK